MAELLTLPEAVAELVADGQSIALEGFTHLIPFAAGHEILRQGRRELELIRMTPDVVYDQMVGVGAACKLVFSYGGNPGVGSLHRFRDAIEHGWPRAVEIQEHTHATPTRSVATATCSRAGWRSTSSYDRVGRRGPDDRTPRAGYGRASSGSGGRASRRCWRGWCTTRSSSSSSSRARSARSPGASHSIGDGELAETADAVVSVPEMFNYYWSQPGRIDVAFLGAAQVDRFANLTRR